MVNIIQQTLFFWNILLIDLTDSVPVTRREKLVKVLKRMCSKLLLLNSIIYTLVILPIYQKIDFNDLLGNQKLFYKLAMTFSLCATSAKHILLFKSAQKIKELVTGPLAGNYSKEQQAKYDIAKKMKIMERYLKILKIYVCSGDALLVLQNVVAVVMNGFQASLSMYLPFDVTRIEISLLAFVWIESTTVPLAIVSLITESYICYLVTIATIELDIWRIDFKDLKSLSETEKAKKLPELVDRHNDIFNTVKDVEGIFSSYFLASLVLNSLSMCVNLYQVTAFSDFTRNATNLIICMYMLLLIGMICFFGQMLLDACERISYEIYDCGWEGFKDIELKKKVLMLLMRSQKPAKLTFMKFSDIAMEKFREVLASTYAYFTLLLKLHDKRV